MRRRLRWCFRRGAGRGPSAGGALAARREPSPAEFLQLCDDHAAATGKSRWTLALSKVPTDLQRDDQMRQLLGDFMRRMAATSAAVKQSSVRDAGNERARNAWLGGGRVERGGRAAAEP